MTLTGERNQLASHLRECIAAAERRYTPDELLAAELALHTAPEAPQQSLFSCAANRGVAPAGQPSPVGCGSTDLRNPE